MHTNGNTNTRKKRETRLCLDPERLKSAPLLQVRQFSAVNPAFPEGGIRWSIFKRGNELEAAGAIVRNGKRILIRPERYIEVITGTKAA